MALDFSQVKSIKINQFNQVDYLHFNGVDNYIDSGVSFYDQYIDTNVEFEFSVDSFNSQIWSCASLEIKVNNSGRLTVTGSGFGSSLGNITINTKYKLVINHRAGIYTTFTLYQGETEIGSRLIDQVPVTSTDMYFFAKSYPGTEIPVRNFSAGKLYSFKINKYSYAPYKKISNGEIGLYSDHYATPKIMAGTINNDSVGVIVPPTVEFPSLNVKKITTINNVVLWRSGPRLTSITLAGYTTSLNINSEFSYGGTVTANYSDGSTADVTSETTFSGYDMSTEGTQTVTASYTENGITKTATYELTIVSEEWHTIWEGSKTISWDTLSSTTPSTVNVYECPGDIQNPTNAHLRFTFTMSNTLGRGGYLSYPATSWNETTKPTSPIEIQSLNVTIPTSSSTTPIVGVEATRADSKDHAQKRLQFELRRYKFGSTTYSRFRLIGIQGDITGNPPSGTLYITITKIEQYY